MCRSNMTPKLYMTDMSPPVRSVLLTAKALGITLERKMVNLRAGDNLKPEYLKLNPQHTVPTLEDSGYVIWDSHAIMAYLVGKYAKDDSLYPKNFEKRGVIDQRLHFDSGIVFAALRNVVQWKNGRPEFNFAPKEACQIEEVYNFLEEFLNGLLWIAGDEISIADFSLIPSITTLNLVVPISAERHPNLDAWIKRAQKWSFYEANAAGLRSFQDLIRDVLSLR